jgi:hypothetical protein
MKPKIDHLAYLNGMYCDGTPDAWDSQAISNFAEAIIKECILAIENTDVREKKLTTFDAGMLEFFKERAIATIHKRFNEGN